MKRHLSLSFVTSLLAVVCYLTFALLAFALYPLPYSPMSNWFSDLGNADLNPHGALFYNIGIVATGVVLLLFFIGLSRWKMEKNRRQNFMLRLTQGFGILGALALVISGLYPINFSALHSFFSICLYILLGDSVRFFSCCSQVLSHLPAMAPHPGCLNRSYGYSLFRFTPLKSCHTSELGKFSSTSFPSLDIMSMSIGVIYFDNT